MDLSSDPVESTLELLRNTRKRLESSGATNGEITAALRDKQYVLNETHRLILRCEATLLLYNAYRSTPKVES